MKKILCCLLCAVIACGLFACAAAPGETASPMETTEATSPTEGYSYPEINQKLTWDAINAIPIKRADMPVEELRQLCVKFFRFSKTALWTPDSDHRFIRTAGGTKVVEIFKGNVYGGLPYVGWGSGNIYRLMDYIDEQTGVVRIKDAAALAPLFGNQCSIGAYWGWPRVINSANYLWTSGMNHTNGFLRIGPYTYDDSQKKFTAAHGTPEICQNNGEQIMYQSYAKLQPADGLLQWTTAGHVIMCSSVAHVEYIAGTDQIDGERSYITLIDQNLKWLEGTNESGDTYLYKNSVDETRTFASLFSGSYIPFTFAEFLGTDPVEDTVCEVNLSGDSVTVSQLFSAVVTANYGISDTYAIVKDADGKEVYRHAMRAEEANITELPFSRNGSNVVKWGKLDVSSGEFTVEVLCQLGTGERLSLYSGKLAA